MRASLLGFLSYTCDSGIVGTSILGKVIFVNWKSDGRVLGMKSLSDLMVVSQDVSKISSNDLRTLYST